MYRTTLPDWQWLEFEGPDTADLLQRLSTLDVRALAPGAGAPGCLLNPQGRIVAFFFCWRLSPTRFGFEFERAKQGEPAPLRAELERLTFAEQVQWIDPTLEYPELDYGVSWIVAPGYPLGLATRPLTELAQAGAPPLRILPHESWTAVWGPSAARERWITEQLSTQKPSSQPILTPEQVTLAIEAQRIHGLVPRVGWEITGEENPLELGLISAIADQKGCYPGQEVIEKILALGSPARRLALLSFDSATLPSRGTKVTDPNDSKQEIGRITSSARHPNAPGSMALALLKRTALKQASVCVGLDPDAPIVARVERVSDYRVEPSAGGSR